MIKFIKKLIGFILPRLYTNDTIIIFTLDKVIAQNSQAIIKYASYKNLKDILYFQNERYIDVFKKFLDIGDVGYFGYLGDKCIHRSWVKSNNQVIYPHAFCPYRLMGDEIFIHYCETAPKARGQNIYPHILSKIACDNIGKKILISINDKNIASKKGALKVGFKQIQKIRIIVLFGLKFIKIVKEDYF